MSTPFAPTRIWHRIRWEATATGRSVRAAFTGAGPERDLAVQALKAAAAAVLAWAVAGWWWSAPLALMAPWTAIVLVQNTVYRSLRTGLQQVVLIAAGTVLAALAFALTGSTMASMALVLPVTMLLGNYSRFGDQGVYASTTALFVLVYGSFSGYDIAHRLLETLVGAVIGIGVNAFVLPPEHLRHAHDTLYRLPRDTAAVLRDMAEEMKDGYDRAEAQEWHTRAQRLPRLLDDIRNARLWKRESDRFNPARRMRRRGPELPSSDWDAAWERITDHLSALTGLLAEAVGDEARLRPPSGEALADLPELMRAMAEVCEGDCAALGGGCPAQPVDRDEAMARAWDAHRRLKAWVAHQDEETAVSLGALVSELQQTLYDLGDAMVGHRHGPWAPRIGNPRPQKPGRTA
ncbi:aromatic acid exporter family protein [Streptomyces sp. NPDC046887]|uniref:FUSC family protein n=1 Tax=Streptomyces sp. NPDC046887 TaxID=3155472 RepID=UPI0033F435D8